MSTETGAEEGGAPVADPGAVEAVLREQAGVRDAAAGMRSEGAGRPRMVAWVAADPAAAPDEAALREALVERLPGHVLPSVLLFVEAIPRLADGSADADALPAPAAAAFAAPQGEVEAAIAAVWAEVLGVGEVGVHDNFFDLGGQSVLLLQVHGRLVAALGHEVPLMTLFKYPTVHSLASHLARGGDAPGEDETTRTGQERAESRREMRARRRDPRRGR